jgi:acetyltransferase-like isoleucine patch superfamily enzyme
MGEKTRLTIGRFCSIGGNVKIYVGRNHRTDRITTDPFGFINLDIFNSDVNPGHPKTNGDVTIGNDVWIGSNVVIMSEVTICDGAIIANNSHVVRNVDPYSIVGGNPARLIKFRFNEANIKKRLELKWWNRDEKR